MNDSSVLLTDIFNFLNSNADYAVLRNHDGLPQNNASRDIDILINSDNYYKIEKKIFELIINHDFKIITLYRSEKLVTLVCADYRNNDVEIFQLDFFFNTSLFGIIIFQAKEILKNKIYNGRIYHVSKEYEFLDKYIQHKLLNIDYPTKYNEILLKVGESEDLHSILSRNFACNDLKDLNSRKPSYIFIKLFFNNPLPNIKNIIYFLYFYLKNLFFYRGYSIGFTGPDGSGKTTIINKINDSLRKVYSSITLLHFRPGIFANLGDVAVKSKAISEIDRNYSSPHRGKKTSLISSILRLFYYSFDYKLGFYFNVRPLLVKRYIVIFDRYFTDLISDSRRSRIFLNYKFLYFFKTLLIPKLNYNFLITADPEIILHRKKELTFEGIVSINERLKFLSRKKNYRLFLNNKSLDETIKEILSYLFLEQHKSNLSKTNYFNKKKLEKPNT